MSLAAYIAKTWTDYADSPDLSAANVQYMDSGIAAVTAEVLSLEASLPSTYQPISAELSALAGLSSTGYAKRLGAGSWSVVSAIPQSDVSGLTAALAGLQPLDSDLTAIAALTTTTFGRSLLTVADAAAARTAIGAQVAGSYQASSSVLTSIAAQSSGTGLLKLTAGVASLDSSVYALASSVPVASSTTPAALGTAAVGTGATWARADHVHAMPTAAQVGAEPSLSSGTAGYLLSTNGTTRSWVAPYTHPATHPQSVVDSASGWITTALAGKQAAGSYALSSDLANYLPLTAGPEKSLTGTLYGTTATFGSAKIGTAYGGGYFGSTINSDSGVFCSSGVSIYGFDNSGVYSFSVSTGVNSSSMWSNMVITGSYIQLGCVNSSAPVLHTLPGRNAVSNLGSTALRWNTIYSSTASISSSLTTPSVSGLSSLIFSGTSLDTVGGTDYATATLLTNSYSHCITGQIAADWFKLPSASANAGRLYIISASIPKYGMWLVSQSGSLVYVDGTTIAYNVGRLTPSSIWISNGTNWCQVG